MKRLSIILILLLLGASVWCQVQPKLVTNRRDTIINETLFRYTLEEYSRSTHFFKLFDTLGVLIEEGVLFEGYKIGNWVNYYDDGIVASFGKFSTGTIDVIRHRDPTVEEKGGYTIKIIPSDHVSSYPNYQGWWYFFLDNCNSVYMRKFENGAIIETKMLTPPEKRGFK